MTALPDVVIEAWENREGPAIFATVDEDGTPNVIYVGSLGRHGEDTLVVADNYFDKTRRNLKAGSRGAFLFMGADGKAYQVKGRVEYHTEGEVFDGMKRWNPEKHPGHAAAALKVEAVYSGATKLA
ncbi:MAG: pyridoxamine 5'-phosphate oxidase family protein [Candidatus Brocadiaceae bacterium]|nr:pyridoxamine 5'-phosphate oxidase family protein [Candidatus Brocadiaceae bacterium]